MFFLTSAILDSAEYRVCVPPPVLFPCMLAAFLLLLFLLVSVSSLYLVISLSFLVLIFARGVLV